MYKLLNVLSYYNYKMSKTYLSMTYNNCGRHISLTMIVYDFKITLFPLCQN